jgi:hypothetical protein
MIQRTLRLAGIASALAALTLSTAATAQIKIGFMATMSGPAATLGQDQFDGFSLESSIPAAGSAVSRSPSSRKTIS